MPRPPKNTPRLAHFNILSANVLPSTLGITSEGHVPVALHVRYRSVTEARLRRRTGWVIATMYLLYI
ncbi:Uncharacterised protein [Chlamydia trachomatis]|nr:Uncharacterised protein [Chlamydia trachomatis]CRH60310.1 Uncharacterised protein [Chlamydia trachomatis]